MSVLEKVFTFMNSIPDDKVRHALSGAFLFAIVAQFSLMAALLAVAVIAAAKEVYDHFHPDIHTCDVWDFIATFSGGLLGAACYAAGRGWIAHYIPALPLLT